MTSQKMSTLYPHELKSSPLHSDVVDALPRSSAKSRRFRAFYILALTSVALFWMLPLKYITLYPLQLIQDHVEIQKAHTGMQPFPIPPDVTIERCADWTVDQTAPSPAYSQYSSFTTFELPISSNALFLLSRGYLSTGIINIVHSDDDDDSEVASVDVTVKYWRTDVLDEAQVCLLSRYNNGKGVGIFTPSWRTDPHHPNMDFSVVVRIPKAKENRLVKINAFDTDMPLFSHQVDLHSVEFKEISLKTVNEPIFVKSLYAGNATIRTTNGPIEGSFNSSSSLTLETTNGIIKAIIGLANDDDGDATTAKLFTSNGPIDAIFSLFSSKTTGGLFKASTISSIGKLDIGFLDAPVDSALFLNARTTISPADVKLHETYEGTFSLQSSFYRPKVLVNHDLEDPSGKKRKRAVNIVGTRRAFVEGSVIWSPEGKSRGAVGVVSSISPVTLVV